MTETMLRSCRHDWPTPLLVTTGEVVRRVTPTSLASLVLLDNGTATTQTEIADVINRDQSTVSSTFQSLKLENFDVSLVEKSGRTHTLTNLGKEIVEIVTDAHQLGTELDTVDWGSNPTKNRFRHASRRYMIHGAACRFCCWIR